MAQTQKKLSYDINEINASNANVKSGKKNITLIGTAHISPESIEEVKQTIKENSPDCVCVELDERRYNSMINPNSWKEMDVVKVLKKGEGFLLLANLVLSAFQKRLGKNIGVKPGDEMMAAITAAKEKDIKISLVDRPIQITLKRAWAQNSFWGKIKLLATLIASAFDNEEVSQEQIEELKNTNEMDMMMGELSEYLPKVKEVLIDERDKFLACKIWQSEGSNLCAVLGAGHLPGVEAHLEKIAKGEESTDTSQIDFVPSKKGIAKFVGWIIPIIIVSLIALGFLFGGKSIGTDMIFSWILWNGTLAAIGSLAAAAHPLTVVVAFLCAPLTSLTPVIGVGVITGIFQAIFCKPKVSDMETLQDDALSVRGWYKNRILRVLLVFILSSLGSSIGTFVSGADLIGIFTKFAK